MDRRWSKVTTGFFVQNFMSNLLVFYVSLWHKPFGFHTLKTAAISISCTVKFFAFWFLIVTGVTLTIFLPMNERTRAFLVFRLFFGICDSTDIKQTVSQKLKLFKITRIFADISNFDAGYLENRRNLLLKSVEKVDFFHVVDLIKMLKMIRFSHNILALRINSIISALLKMLRNA